MDIKEILEKIDKLPDILKSTDLAWLFDVYPDKVAELARKGELKGFKKGNQWRFQKKDIKYWIEKNLSRLETIF